MHLQYGAFKRFDTCPERFRRQNVEKEWPTESSHWAIFGSVIQAIFDHFYRDKMWQHPETVQQELIDMVPDEMARFLERNWVDWNAQYFDGDEDSVADEVREHIPPVLQAIKDFRILGERNLSEFYLKAKVKGEHTIGGQADFLIYRRSDILLIDGKGGKKGPKALKTAGKYKYISKDQLLFYALTYLLKWQKLPTLLAFLWYRFAEETEDGYNTEPMWDELHWTKGDISELRDRIVETLDKISRKEFEATPSSKACNFCPFKEPGPGQCVPYKRMRLDKSRKKRGKLVIPDTGEIVF